MKSLDKKGVLLIVDDEPDMLPFLKRTISAEIDWEILTALSAKEALRIMDHHLVDVVLLDIKMPEMDGLELLSLLKDKKNGPTAVMMTAYGVIDLAVEAIRKGAYDFLTKPLDDTRLILTLQKAMEYHLLFHENQDLQRLIRRQDFFQNMIGVSEAMQHVFETIRTVAETDVTVLITGESGTGKELVARAIHQRSGRKGKNFVPVNCPALPEHILETELFGYVRGAFTDAKQDKQGLFQEAQEGTLFLDEIGDLPINLQTKLLRVLQEKEIKPLGSPKSLKVDVRVLASTNRDLKKKMAQGEFREDLYYRLNVISLHLPSLRERPEDIPLLAAHFLKKYAIEYSKKGLKPGPGLMEELGRLNWPGNVRELENTIRRAVILGRGTSITTADLGSEKEEKGFIPQPVRDLSYRQAKRKILDSFNQQYLSNLLTTHQGNVTHAAKKCGLERQAFQQLLRRYGIKSEDYRNPS
jgi:DNA-binding NtrC family response regulator